MSDTKQFPEAYSGLETLPIGERWRTGRSTRSLTNTYPFKGKTLVDIPLASVQDVDEACESASAAQKARAAAAPAERALVLHKVGIFDARREEIISWLIQKAGSMRLKATIEWENVRAITLEAASFPHRVAGHPAGFGYLRQGEPDLSPTAGRDRHHLPRYIRRRKEFRHRAFWRGSGL